MVVVVDDVVDGADVVVEVEVILGTVVVDEASYFGPLEIRAC